MELNVFTTNVTLQDIPTYTTNITLEGQLLKLSFFWNERLGLRTLSVVNGVDECYLQNTILHPNESFELNSNAVFNDLSYSVILQKVGDIKKVGNVYNWSKDFILCFYKTVDVEVEKLNVRYGVTEPSTPIVPKPFSPPYDLVVEFKSDETNRLELNWKLDGFVDEQRYYCSETHIDTENLPLPKAILTGDSRAYVDTDVEIGKTYFMYVSSVRNNIEKFSSEVSVNTFDHPVLSLFENSEKGFWFDFNDKSSMYQDSAATTPVTAFSQPIGKVLDKSGNGNHAVQYYSSNSPVIQSNGAYFDGANNSLRTVNEVDYAGSENIEVFVKIESLYRSNKAYFCVFESGDPFNQNPVGFIALAREDNYTITAGISTSTNPAQNVTHLYRGAFLTYDGIFSLSANDTECILNVVSDDVVLRKPKPAGIQISNNFLNIGARYNNSDLHYYGYIKQIVCVNRILTAVERSNLIAFMDAS